MKKEKKDLTQNNAAGKSADKKRIFVIAGVVVACLAVMSDLESFSRAISALVRPSME